jgi:hypothetical protein
VVFKFFFAAVTGFLEVWGVELVDVYGFGVFGVVI